MTKGDGFLDGKLLIAMPSMTDPRFHKAVIYLCAHSEDGAMGIVLNQRADHITFRTLLEQLDIEPVETPETVAWVDPIHKDPNA